MPLQIDPTKLMQLTDKFSRNLQHIAGRITQLERFRVDTLSEKQLDGVNKVIDGMQTKNAAYTNVLIIAGYAAYFSFWSTLKPDLPKWLFAPAGCLIIVSLLIFISWEVGQMIWRTIKINSLQKDLNSKADRPFSVDEFQGRLRGIDRRTMSAWPWFVVPAVVAGIASALCLVGFFLLRLAHSVFS